MRPIYNATAVVWQSQGSYDKAAAPGSLLKLDGALPEVQLSAGPVPLEVRRGESVAGGRSSWAQILSLSTLDGVR